MLSLFVLLALMVLHVVHQELQDHIDELQSQLEEYHSQGRVGRPLLQNSLYEELADDGVGSGQGTSDPRVHMAWVGSIESYRWFKKPYVVQGSSSSQTGSLGGTENYNGLGMPSGIGMGKGYVGIGGKPGAGIARSGGKLRVM